MEWTKAKKFVIMLLVILNICLFGLNYQQKRESAMTASQERAIFEVLSQNGITMYTNLITEYEPMRRLSVTVPFYTKEELEHIFFVGEKTTVVPGNKSTIYTAGKKRLVLEGQKGTLTFGNAGEKKTTATPMASKEATDLAQEYMDDIQTYFPDFTLAGTTKTEDGFAVEFYGSYKKHPVFSNCFRFLISNHRITKIEFTYYHVSGYFGEKKDIFYSDEALLTFMREQNTQKHTEEITVNRIELGYSLLKQGDIPENGTFNLIPCYRIYTMEQKEPCLINAYTCQIIK